MAPAKILMAEQIRENAAGANRDKNLQATLPS